MKEIKYWTVMDGDINPEWITKSIDDKAICWAEIFGHYLADPERNKEGKEEKDEKGKTKKQTFLTTSQLRKFFGEIRRIQNKFALSQSNSSEWDSEIRLLKPKLAYQVGREKDKRAKIKDFYEQLSIGINSIKNLNDFKRFIKMTEAIVAYHKEIEPKNS